MEESTKTKSTMPQSRFQTLPVEVKQSILSDLPDISSIISAAMTCSSLYHALKDAESIIVTTVLQNQIDINVLPEAVAQFASANIRPISKESVYLARFVEEHLRCRNPCSRKWSISEALPLSDFHKAVHYVATDFATSALEKTGVSHPPTRKEICRIERAFYRYEIYRNLFGNAHVFHANEQKAIFFIHFSAWENEQLACVHDYFFRRLAPVFNEIVEHDITWGEFCVAYAIGPESDHIQHILSLGISKIVSILQASTPEECSKTICSLCPPAVYPGNFLFKGMRASNKVPYTAASQLNSDFEFFSDGDLGPKEAWIWARNLQSGRLLGGWAGTLFNWEGHEGMREWGYVMWDRRRLDELEVLSTSWEDSCSNLRRARPEVEAKQEMLQASWKRRSQIHLAGGRGWWSADDESRVLWRTGERSPYDDAKKRKECPFCIGEVYCAPHRLKLKIPVRTELGATDLE